MVARGWGVCEVDVYWWAFMVASIRLLTSKIRDASYLFFAPYPSFGVSLAACTFPYGASSSSVIGT